MNPADNNSSERKAALSQPVLATEAWHRFITCFCLLACAGFIVIGVDRLFDPTEGRAVPASPMDYFKGEGAFFVVYGIAGCCFLIRQFRAPASTSTRKPRTPNDRDA